MPGIYIHIPFCRQACHYCNFHFSVSGKRIPEFVEALLAEITLQKNFFANSGAEKTVIDTLYLGGGTPSLLSIDQLNAVFSMLRSCFTFKPDAEITIEVNPDDLDVEKLDRLGLMGVNRLSIGIQSFREADLRYMNRSHNSQQALNVLTEAVNVGFTNITADLIYGTPGLDDLVWEKNIMQLIDRGIPHISAYSLTVEKKTALDVFIRKGKAAPVDEEQAARQFSILCNVAAGNGYDHYEISNFGKPGYHSRHNLGYWSGQPYLGLGPSAHSFAGGRRRWNLSNTGLYINNILSRQQIPFEEETLTLVQQLNEYIMTSLRTMWGLDMAKVEREFGPDFLASILKDATKHLDNRFLVNTGSHLKVSQKGLFFADGIASDLFQ